MDDLPEKLFPGHPNANAEPRNVREGTIPKRMRNRQARMIVTMFLRTGKSTHSASGSTLWVVDTIAAETNAAVYVDHARGIGYVAKLLKPPVAG